MTRSARAPAFAERPVPRRLRCLVVDDHPAVVQAIVAILTPALKVEAAGDGATAIAAIGRDPPDVVLLDLKLPDMSGLRVLEAVRPLHLALPVVILTGHSSEPAAIAAANLAVSGYLVKPFSVADLTRAVSLALVTRLGRVLRPSPERAALGRFLSEDPLNLTSARLAKQRHSAFASVCHDLQLQPGFPSSYSYVQNRPLNSVDPLGLFSVDVGGGVNIGPFDITCSFTLGIVARISSSLALVQEGTSVSTSAKILLHFIQERIRRPTSSQSLSRRDLVPDQVSASRLTVYRVPQCGAFDRSANQRRPPDVSLREAITAL